jgi:hypothetical protein
MNWQTAAASPTLRPWRYASSVLRNWLPTGPWLGAASTSSVDPVRLATSWMVCEWCLPASAEEDEATTTVTLAGRQGQDDRRGQDGLLEHALPLAGSLPP